MEKISGIIPSSRRVSTVDMSDAAPVRPGVPSFGRPTGKSGLETTVNKSTIASSATTNFASDLRSQKEVSREALVNNLSDAFFMLKSRGSENPDKSENRLDTKAESLNVPAYIRPGRYIDVKI